MVPGPGPGPGYWPGPNPGPSPGPLGDNNVYYHQHQQANMMASRLQQMAMEESNMAHGYRGNGGVVRQRQYEQVEVRTASRTSQHLKLSFQQEQYDYEDTGDRGEGEYGGGGSGMKRQMNSQGGNRGKKNRGGWNR